MMKRIILLSIFLFCTVSIFTTDNMGSIIYNPPADSFTVTIGGPYLSSFTFPYYYWACNSLCEMIYYSEELADAGMEEAFITSMTYYYCDNASYPGLGCNIWIGETDLISPPHNWISASDLQIVFAGEFSAEGFTGSVEFNFIEPYHYTGDNLVILLNHPWDGLWGGNLGFYMMDTYQYPDRSKSIYSDTFEYNPYDPPLAGSYLSYIPYTTFVCSTYVNDADDQFLKQEPIASFKNVYPNPFNPIIYFDLEILQNSTVDIAVYNLLGKHIKTVFGGELNRGRKTFFWDGRDNRDKVVTSGIYFTELSINGSTTEVKKIVLLK